MPDSKEEIARKFMRDIVLINMERYPDWQSAGRTWADKLSAARPYNVVGYRPGDDLTSFGAQLTQADHVKLNADGALLLKPLVQGRA